METLTNGGRHSGASYGTYDTTDSEDVEAFRAKFSEPVIID